MAEWNYRLLAPIRSLKMPNAEIEVSSVPNKPGAFKLIAKSFAMNVCLSPHDCETLPNDNFFDLLPRVEKEILRYHPPRGKVHPLGMSTSEQARLLEAAPESKLEPWGHALRAVNQSEVLTSSA